MAGAASVAESWESPDRAFALNAVGVGHLLEAVARHAPGAHMLCVSSAEVYGESSGDRLPFSEESAPGPVTPYGASKAAMEVLCDQYARRGLRIAVVRAFSLLGPGQLPAFSASGFSRQIAAAELAGEEGVELSVGNPSAARDFTDVRDTARAFAEVSAHESDRRLQPLLRQGAEAGGPGRGDGEGHSAADRDRARPVSCPPGRSLASSTAAPIGCARRSGGSLASPSRRRLATCSTGGAPRLAAA